MAAEAKLALKEPKNLFAIIVMKINYLDVIYVKMLSGDLILNVIFVLERVRYILGRKIK